MIRLRLLNFPLERDEGEYAYGGQLILQGIAPYQLCYSMKLPGTAAAYALFMALFGQTPSGVHLGLLLVNSASIILIYLLARRIFDRLAGVVACAGFAVLSLGPSIMGFAGHATQFVVLTAIGGILILLKAIESEKPKLFFWSGLLLGLAFLMKQPGLLLLLFALFYLAFREWKVGLRWRSLTIRLGMLLLGAALPFSLTCLILWRAGVFAKFWFWTFSYAREYGAMVPFSQGLENFWGASSSVVGPAVLVWLIAATGLIALLWNPKARIHAVLVIGLLAFSFAAVCPGFYFREHYFVLLLPAVALLCGAAVSILTAFLRDLFRNPAWAVIPSFFFVLALGAAVFHDGAFFFRIPPVVSCRTIYGQNPFPEALKIADYIARNSAEGDPIAVLGSEPEIYFYSHRRSATGYVYAYPLMEPQPFASDMQRQMISEIEKANPRFVVLVDIPQSWLRRADSDTTILSWSDGYIRSGYQLVGIADLLDEGTEYRWDNDAISYSPRSPFQVLLYQRSQ
jgi:4-amino-4-deoxy-L-arabinose transferase-like glycosyltransferase